MALSRGIQMRGGCAMACVHVICMYAGGESERDVAAAVVLFMGCGGF